MSCDSKIRNKFSPIAPRFSLLRIWSAMPKAYYKRATDASDSLLKSDNPLSAKARDFSLLLLILSPSVVHNLDMTCLLNLIL